MFLSRKVMEVQIHSQELFDVNLRRATPWVGCSKWLESLCLQLCEQDSSALAMMFCHKTRLSTLLHWWKKYVLEERLESWGCGVRNVPMRPQIVTLRMLCPKQLYNTVLVFFFFFGLHMTFPSTEFSCFAGVPLGVHSSNIRYWFGLEGREKQELVYSSFSLILPVFNC